MTVIITAPEVVSNGAAKTFAKMLSASLSYRMIDNQIIASTDSPFVLDVSTSEAMNSEYAKKLGTVADPEIHFDVRSFNPGGGSNLDYLDFIVFHADGVTNDSLNDITVQMLSNFSEAQELTLAVDVMYANAYCALVYDIPTICLVVNEGSADLYRAAADEMAELVENLEVE